MLTFLRRALFVVVATMLVAGGLATLHPAAAAPDRWLVGYYPVYNRALMPPKTIPWSSLTHIAVGAALPRSNGTLDTSFYLGSAAEGEAFAKGVAKRARNNGVTPLLMLGGAGTRVQFFDAMAPAKRDQFVKNIVATMKGLGFTGVNVDWEELPPEDFPRLRILVTALRNALPKADITVSALWPTLTFPDVDPTWKAIAAKADRVDLMTYGMSGDWDGWKSWHSSALKGAKPDTPSSVAVSVKSYLNAGVPAKKLQVGVGFYGTCWQGVTGPNQDISGPATDVANDNIMTFGNIMDDYYKAGAYRYDAGAEAPYLTFNAKTGPEKCNYISYEDKTSIKAKADWLINRGLGGVIIWEITEGRRDDVAASKRDALLLATHNALGL